MNPKDALGIIRKVRDDYNAIAAEWDETRNFINKLKLNLIKPIKPGMRVLDLGCGNGKMLPEVLKKGASYVGLDISAKLLAMAKKKHVQDIKNKRAKFVLGNVIKLPFKNNSFDFVFSFAVLHHLPSEEFRQQAFKEIARVLKKDGRAVVIVWNLLNEWAEKRFKIKAQLRAGNKVGKLTGNKLSNSGYGRNDVLVPWLATKNKKVMRYFHLFFPAELRQLAKQAGFSRCDIGYYDKFTGKQKNNGEGLVARLNVRKLGRV